MSIKIISYDLGAPETSGDYKDLIKFIKGLGDTCKPLESLWLVNTNKKCEYIRNEAKQYMDSNDRIFVARWGVDDWAGLRLRNEAGKWLNNL
ncbi:MAG: SinR family protein [Patescibacteria group bacterium]